MTVRVHPQLSLLPAVGLGLAAVLITTGCGVATPGPTDYAGGPASDSPTHLSAFPMPNHYIGGVDNLAYKAGVGVLTGTGPRNVTTKVAASMVLWLGCGGTAGSATMTSPDMGLNWSVPCGSTGDPRGIEFQARQGVGQIVKILVTAPTSAVWEIRIDAAPHEER
jgi:hypothetical protein